MSKGPGRKTKHHRKPRSLGGKDIIAVTRREHEAWHCLFSNLAAPEILLRFLYFYHLFTGDVLLMEPRLMPWCTCEQLKAWIILFGNMGLEDMVNIINTTWLDLDFKFIISVEGPTKVGIKKVARRKKVTIPKRRS